MIEKSLLESKIKEQGILSVEINNLFEFEDKYIKLYSRDKDFIPKNTEEITILNAQLAPYKGNMQIIFHSINDYKELKWD